MVQDPRPKEVNARIVLSLGIAVSRMRIFGVGTTDNNNKLPLKFAAASVGA